MWRVNLGGEGEVPGALNQQEPAALRPGWRSVQPGRPTLYRLALRGVAVVICFNTMLTFPDDSIDEVYTNSVPIDIITFRGPGVQSSEILRVLKSRGRWYHNQQLIFLKP